MIESSVLEEEQIVKDVKNLFRLKKPKTETIDTTIKDIRSIFILEKENKTIKDRMLRKY